VTPLVYVLVLASPVALLWGALRWCDYIASEARAQERELCAAEVEALASALMFRCRSISSTRALWEAAAHLRRAGVQDQSESREQAARQIAAEEKA
jgi:hypothetical protein